GAVRFLQRVWRLISKWHEHLSEPSAVADGLTSQNEPPADHDGGPRQAGSARRLRQKTHQVIKRVTDSFETLQFNTPVAALMELSNAIGDVGVEPDKATDDELYAVREALTALTIMLTPFAPHTAEELFSVLIGNENGIIANGARFPEYNEELAKADEIEIPVQINGKLRSRVMASPETTNEELEAMAKSDEKIREHINDKQIVKVIVVPKRLVNIVIR
ncbi:MAG TPA: class I tRNA ligase family protein, partial [Pyrinomonadaceae bacterium]|nr:class I tRNA ligase family protein [Pyrinomonadaceae bacterium]